MKNETGTVEIYKLLMLPWFVIIGMMLELGQDILVWFVLSWGDKT